MQALRADVLERVVRRVPGGVVEIDDVDGCDAGLEEGQVVVFDRRGLRRGTGADGRAARAAAQMMSVSQRRRVRLAADVEVPVADHVEQDERLDAVQRAGGLRACLHVVAAAVGGIGGAPLDDRFLAVEEQQLDGERPRPILEHARQLEQRRGARAAVAGADEAELAEQLGVEVAGEDDALGPRARAAWR